jgi:hypothetical protein
VPLKWRVEIEHAVDVLDRRDCGRIALVAEIDADNEPALAR